MAIRVELELQDGSFTTRMIHAGESVQQFRDNVGQGIVAVSKLNESTGSLLGTMRDLTLTLGMARAAFENIRAVTTGWAGDIVRINADMEKLTVLLKGMSTAAKPLEDAGNSVKWLREQAVLAPFSLSALTDTFVKMKSTGIDPMKGSFKSMVDAVAAFGGTDDVLKRATIAITQMSGKGVIQMEELRQQLGEAVPRAVELMARSMGLSMGQLVKLIATGTLDAKSSLQALSIEMDNTFGGAAAAQMKTFNGMMTQTTSLMQTLAMKVGDAGFFEAVKGQLSDFNKLLAGPVAAQWASSLGRGLTSLIGWLRTGADTIVSFKNEIMLLGQALALAFGAKLLNSALLSMGSLFATMRADIALTRVQLVQFNNAMAGSTAMIAGIRSVSDAMAAMSLVGTGLTRMLPLLATGLGLIAGYAVPLIGAIFAIGMAFDLFSNKAKDAYDDLAKFGAQSKKQIEDAKGYLTQQEALLEGMKTSGGNDYSMTGVMFSDAEINAQIAKVTLLRTTLAKGEADFSKRSGEEITRAKQDALDEELSRMKAANDIREKGYADAYGKELEATQKNRGDVKAVQVKYADDQRARSIAFMNEELALMQQHQDALNVLRDFGDQETTATYDKQNAALAAKMKDLADRRNMLMAMPTGAQTAPKLDDIDAMVTKAKNKLEDMKAEISGVRAELAGASGEYAKLAFMINEAQAKGNYVGPLSNQQIRETTDALLEQQKVFDDLTAKKNGQNKLAADLERANVKAHEDLIDAQTEGMTEGEKLQFKMRAGLYDGQSAMQRLTSKWVEVGAAAQTAGEDMRKALESLTNPTQQSLSFLDKVKLGFSGLAASRSGLNLPPVSTGNSLTDRIIGSESNGNNNAANPNSTAKGAGQFIESTWLDFLKALHPDMLAAGKQAALDLRSNGAMSREATEWLMQQNTRQFEKNGIEPTDANLKLGHFLGGGGATAALQASNETLVRAIPALQQAILSNYNVFKNISTVADLKNWSQRQVGSGTSRVSSGNDDLMRRGGQASLDDTLATEAQTRAVTARKKLKDAEKAFFDGIIENAEADAGKLSNLAATRKKIADGKGPDGMYNRNADDPKYDDLYDAAKKKDESDALYDAKKKNRALLTAAETRRLSNEDSVQARNADLLDRLSNERKFKASGEFYAQEKAYRKELSNIDAGVKLGNISPEEAKTRRAALQNDLEAFANKDVLTALKAEQEKTIAIENSSLTVGQMRDKQLADDIRRNETYLQQWQGNGEGRVEVERQVARNIAALRKQAFDATPFGKMIKEFGDINNNFNTTAVGWMGGFNDKLTDLVTKGKADWKSMTDAMLADLIKVGLKAAESKLFSSLLGGDLFGMGGGSSIPLPGQSSFIGPVATNHSGGIAGSGRSPTMNVDHSMFIGAPRFHTGSKGMTLGGDEIPIIAKRGEQTDWPENLAKQYGGDNVKQSNQFNVTVNGSAGSPKQNDDLAAKIGSQLQDAARQMVAKELRTQMKPGGILK